MRDSSPQLWYIAAASHSGSTLLAMLLNSHHDIVTAGELKLSNIGDLHDYRCSCREIIGDCRVWLEIIAAMNASGEDFDLADARMHLADIPSAYVQKLVGPLHRGRFLESVRDAALFASSTWRHSYATWKKRNVSLLRSVAKVSGCNVVVDSSKISVRAKYLFREKALNTRVIRLIRDGRAVALTYMDAFNYADARNPELRGGGRGKQTAKDLPMRDAAREWRRSNEEAEALIRTLRKDQWIQIRYEDLCTDVEGTLGEITDFFGLSRGAGYREFKNMAHHVIGNGMRLDGSSEVVLDQRWKEVLTDAHLEEFDHVAGTLNRSYGYA